MIGSILTIYLIGFVVFALVAYGAIAHEPTAHGQSILLPLGCLVVLFWPIALVWMLIIGICLGLRWLFTGKKFEE